MAGRLLGLVLDNSGVVGNHFDIVLDCVNYVLWYHKMDPISAKFLTNHFAMPDQFYRRFFRGLDAEKCVALHRQRLQESAMAEPLPGAVAGVRKLYAAGMPLCIYSSHPYDKIVSELEHWEISDCFRWIVGGADKRRPDGLITVLQTVFRCPRGSIGYVGDTSDDLKLARKVHIQFKYIPSGFQNPAVLKKQVSEEDTFESLDALADSLV